LCTAVSECLDEAGSTIETNRNHLALFGMQYRTFLEKQKEAVSECLDGAGSTIETNTIHLVLFGMQDRTFSPYLAAIHRILIPVMAGGRGSNLDPLGLRAAGALRL
jgi:hypothetical protein